MLELFNRALGAALALDPQSRARLAELDGKVFCLQLTQPAMTLYLATAATGLRLYRTPPAAIDVTLRGDARAVARLLGWGSPNAATDSAAVRMQGDAECGQRLQKILAQMDVDWEEGLAQAIGDTPARKVGNALRSLTAWLQHSTVQGRQNTVDYLTEEKPILSSAPAAARFEKSVRELRRGVDRLALRIDALDKPPT